MDREMTKITKELIENGYSSVRHPDDGEYPDNWFVFTVWKSSGEKNLWLQYDWSKGIYHFYMWPARNKVKLVKNRSYDVYKVNDIVKEEFGRYLPLARKAGRTLIAKDLYMNKDPEALQLINEDYDTFVSLVSWFCDGEYDEYTAGLETEGENPHFIMGDSSMALKKLKRLGYKSVTVYEENGIDSTEYLLDTKFRCRAFDWGMWKEEMEEYITGTINNELGDCIRNSSYDEKERKWFYELDLGEMYEEEIKTFIRSWNKKKPYKIRCSRSDCDTGVTLAFKNAIKY